MMKSTVALSALLAVGAAGGALAQEQIEEPAISGTIQSVDPTSRTVVLDNGQSYTMGESADMTTLEQGAEVDLSCDAAGTNCMTVTSESPQNDAGPETEQPSAGTEGGTDTGTTTTPSNTAPTQDTSGSGAGTDEGGTGTEGGSSSVMPQEDTDRESQAQPGTTGPESQTQPSAGATDDTGTSGSESGSGTSGGGTSGSGSSSGGGTN